MNSFIYDIPTKVYFGENQLCHLGEALKKYGTRVLLTYGGGSIKKKNLPWGGAEEKTSLYDSLIKEMQAAGLEVFELSGIEPNPRIETVRAGADLCKEHHIDMLLAVGGGSTIDATKFMAAGACVDHDPWDFFVNGAPIEKALPIVTVLTIAATGSEMDDIGVISNMGTRDKIGKGAPVLRPRTAFLDPTLTYSVSRYQTACGAADILSHIMETYFTREHDLYMLDCAMEGLMKTVIKFGPIALESPEDYEARANLMWASSWAINGFVMGGKHKVWSCHAMEHQLSAVYDITHGLGLAILTPRWMEYCLSEETLPKYVQFGVNVFGIDASLPDMEIAEKSIQMLKEFLFDKLGLDDRFSKIGIEEKEFPAMAVKACKGNKIAGFRTLYPEDVENIYRMCL